MKTSVTMQLNFNRGTNIEDAFEDAVMLANKIGCSMQFEFNGIRCIATPNSDPKTGVKSFRFAVKNNHKSPLNVSPFAVSGIEIKSGIIAKAFQPPKPA